MERKRVGGDCGGMTKGGEEREGENNKGRKRMGRREEKSDKGER